jgi:outer membrane protein assembly factor BamD
MMGDVHRHRGGGRSGKSRSGVRVWALAGLGCLALAFLASCGGYPDDIDIGQGLDETDRNLMERARVDLRRGNYTRARLMLQTLMGTYPDSEYVEDAMYAAAESYYQVGARADMVQADSEFNRFQVFFPTSDKADDAQMMRAMTHIRQMQKSDRDPQEALLAEQALETLISDYPDSNLLEEAKVKLRAVQDVIADGYLKIGNHYFTIGAYLAALSRYDDVLEEYPDFSGIPEVTYRVGEVYRRAGDLPQSVVYYSRIVRDHPYSEFSERAVERLTEMGQPVPDVSEAVQARLEIEEEEPVRSLASRMFGIFGGRPNVSLETTAASILNESNEEGESGDGEFSVDGVILDVGGPPGEP